MNSIWVLVLVLAAAVAFGVWRRYSDGRMRDTVPKAVPAGASKVSVDTAGVRSHGGARLELSSLGLQPGDKATLVQFSSAFCQPCKSARLLLSLIADENPQVRFVDIDAEQHMDLVRKFDVRRTPTIFVLDSSGTIRKRAVGLPRRVDVVAALATLEATDERQLPAD